MIRDKILAHFFLDLEVLPIDSELLLPCQSLVMSKEDDLVRDLMTYANFCDLTPKLA